MGGRIGPVTAGVQHDRFGVLALNRHDLSASLGGDVGWSVRLPGGSGDQRYFGEGPSARSAAHGPRPEASVTPERSSARAMCADICGLICLAWVSGSMWPAAGR